MRTSATMHAVLICTLGTLCACGGGGGSSTLPSSSQNNVSSPVPVQSVAPAPTTGVKPTAPNPTPVPPRGQTPTPLPSATPTQPPATSKPPTPTPPPTPPTPTPIPTQIVPSASGPLTLLQVFDTEMTAAGATAAARQVSWVWGAGAGVHGATATAWLAGNPNLIPILYTYQGVDDPRIDPNTINGSHLAWFEAKHPDWIVYDCNAQKQPTTTIAYQPGLPTEVPLDFSNPAVASYQMHVAAAAAINQGATAIGTDQTVFFDFDGDQKPGYFGCGVYTGPNHTGFVRHWSGGWHSNDPVWAADVAQYVKLSKEVLTTDTTLAPHHLKLVINHPTGVPSDPNEQTLVQYADANLDESGFGDYGNYTSGGLLGRTLRYMTFTQSHATFLVIDKFGADKSCCPTTGVTASQLSWAIGSFLLGNLGRAALYVTSGAYGSPAYFPEYATVNARIGTACGAYATSGTLYYRKFSGGYVVANDSTSAVTARLPLAASAYADMEGRALTNPLVVHATDAYVLFSSTRGC